MIEITLKEYQDLKRKIAAQKVVISIRTRERDEALNRIGHMDIVIGAMLAEIEQLRMLAYS